MDFLYKFLVGPWIEMLSSPVFFGEGVIGGLLSGVMYSLVALGFVLIFKASGVFNFAQGVMVLFAALTLVGLLERGVPVVPALVLTTAGVGVVAVLAVFFQRPGIGRALRAVADDHEAALSIGIPLKTIWIVVWSVAGLVALVAGVMGGAKRGGQFSLSLLALKALPVLILGGFTSVPGAIVGGLIIGVGEKLGEVYWGPLVGGAIENWFGYVMALVFLLFRPPGLFGEKVIERG